MQKVIGEETAQLAKEGEKMSFVYAFVYRVEDSQFTAFLFAAIYGFFACLMLNHLGDNNEC